VSLDGFKLLGLEDDGDDKVLDRDDGLGGYTQLRFLFSQNWQIGCASLHYKGQHLVEFE
jgi:hypothetical protein